LINDHPFFKHILAEHPEPENFAEFLASCQRPLRKSIRVNTLKISVSDFKELVTQRGWILTPVPWCNEGFWVDEINPDAAIQLGNCGEHLMGLFYIQEASSMLPASALLNNNNPKLVLDMAAAPGSKTTQLAALMNNEGTILANELSSSRLKVLQANLQRCGVSNTSLTHFDGVLLCNYLANTFDAILLDAPCGGEGTYRKDPRALDNWSLDAIQSISAIQKQLLLSAWKMLKPGGRLVYSTCTLSKAENHDVINWLSTEVGDDVDIVNLQGLFKGASKVLSKEGYLHIWPEIFDCEGFFLACLQKKATTSEKDNPVLSDSSSPFKTLDKKTLHQVVEYYQQHFGFDLLPFSPRLKIRSGKREQQVWLFSEFSNKLSQSIRLQRSGIRICDLINSRKGMIIKTNHEFVTCFEEHFVSNIVELSSEQATECFQGNNIATEACENINEGEVVMCFKGMPLGLGKPVTQSATTRIKNNLPRSELRINATFPPN